MVSTTAAATVGAASAATTVKASTTATGVDAATTATAVIAARVASAAIWMTRIVPATTIVRRGTIARHRARVVSSIRGIRSIARRRASEAVVTAIRRGCPLIRRRAVLEALRRVGSRLAKVAPIAGLRTTGCWSADSGIRARVAAVTKAASGRRGSLAAEASARSCRASTGETAEAARDRAIGVRHP